MALGRKVNNTINIVLLEDLQHLVVIADVGLNKCIIRGILNILQIGQIACIGQFIEVNDMIIGIFIYKKAHYMVTNKTCTACDQYIFHRIVVL